MGWVALRAPYAVGQQMAGQKKRSVEDSGDSLIRLADLQDGWFTDVYVGVLLNLDVKQEVFMMLHSLTCESWLAKITLNLKVFLHLVFCLESCVSSFKAFHGSHL